MIKKIISLILTVVTVFGVTSALGLSAQAVAVIGTEYGTMQDTSNPSNGVLKWAFTYDMYEGTATLSITGNGYMPNDTEDSWYGIQGEVQCFITKVTIGEGVKSIMNNAFAYEIYLESVKLPSTLEIIGSNAFAYTSLKTLNIPQKVKTVSGDMFVSSPIEKFTVSKNNKYLTAYNGDIYSKDMTRFIVSAPGKFNKTKGVGFEFPASVTAIEENAFYASPVEQIAIPGTVKEVKALAFAGSSLSSLHIDSGVEKLYDSAFLACENLVSIALPSSIKYLGWYSVGYTYELDSETLEYLLDEAGYRHPDITMDNVATYAALLDYDPDAFLYFAPSSLVTIYAATGSVGEKYALQHNINLQHAEADAVRVLSASVATGGMYLQWTASPNATGYKIYRRTYYDTWDLIGTVNDGKKTAFIDTNPDSYFKNEYAVASFNKKGYSYCPQSGLFAYYIGAPKLLSAEVQGKKIKVKWSAVDNAHKYRVYRKLPGEASWTYLADVGSDFTEYIDEKITAGKTYIYTVRALNSNVGSSYYKNGITVKYTGPVKLTASNVTNGMKLKWTHAGNADSYRIYRKTTGGSWSLIKVEKGYVTTYTDKNVKFSTEYVYRIFPVYDGELISTDMAQSIYKAIETPFKFTVKNTGSGAYIKWSKCSGASGYYIYRKLPGASSWTRIATLTNPSTLSYTDKTASSGTAYLYTVRAYSGKFVSGFNTAGVKNIFLTAPKKNGIKSTASGVTVSYTKTANASGYYIYRKEGASGWKLVGNVKNGSTLSFTDKTAQKGVTYTYTVRAYKSGYLSSFYPSGQTIKDRY